MPVRIETQKNELRPSEKLRRAWLLFFFFFRIGFFTFGGGWSIIAQMTREFV